jgi:predicted mannosyl-3-phosphoglycerate phosphatase (HAD superfamily)
VSDKAKETVDDMNNLRHMLGVGSHIPKRDWGYRNYFNAGPGHHDMPSLERLVAAGLVEQFRTEYFRATDAGMRAIGLTAKQIEKAKAP